MNKKPVILGIDFGLTKIGVSKTDELHFATWPLTLITYANSNLQEAAKKLSLIIKENRAKILVIGYPLYPDGNISPTCQIIDNFITIMKGLNTDLTFIKQDERFTTQAARNIYKKNPFLTENKGKFKEYKDVIAACLILETYLNKQNEY